MKEIANILAPERGTFFAPLNLIEKPTFKRDKHADNVRKLLNLDSTETDWFVKGPLVAMYSFPELLQMLPTTLTNGMLPYALPTEKIYTENCEITQINDKIKLTWAPATLPKSIKTKLTIVNGQGVFERLKERYTLPMQVIEDKILVFDGLELVFPSCSFALKVGVTFTRLNLYIPPNTYPYDAVADMLSKNNSLSLLLNRNGLLDSFHASPDSFYKVGLTAATLVKDAIK